jgi:uncharacterized protein (TIGR02246 family)
MQSQAEVSAIRATIDRLEAAWEAGDGTAWAACFTPEGDFVTWFGAHQAGPAAIRQSHQMIFEGMYKGTCVAFDIVALRCLVPGIALAHLHGWVYPAGSPRPKGEPQVAPLAVLRRLDDGWSVEAFHNTPAILPPPNGGNIEATLASFA